MNKALEISRFFYLVGIIVLPFIVFPYSYTPYTLSKTLFLILITTLSLVFFILSKPKEYKIPNILLIITLLIESLRSLIDFNFFLFPRYTDHFLISVTLFFFIFLTINLFKKIDFEKTIFFSSFIVVIPSLIGSFYTNERASGTFGQANFLGIYLVLLLLILFKNFNQYILIINRYLLITYALIISVLFIKTASISSLLSLIIGLGILFTSIITKSKFDYKKIIIVTVSLSLVLLMSGQLFIAKTIDIFNQIANPEQTIISDSFIIRTKIWNGTLNLLKNEPIFLIWGYGPNNFSFNFERIRGDTLKGLSEENFLYDKPHNYYLELITSYGLIYLFMFIYLIFKTLKFNSNLKVYLLPILTFIFFNWLDIYLKVILFTFIVQNLPNYKIKSSIYINITVIVVSLISAITFSQLFYRDTSFYFNNTKYFYSYKKEDVENLRVKDPIVLIYFLQFRSQNEFKEEIFDFLMKNFYNNQAVLFNLNKLF